MGTIVRGGHALNEFLLTAFEEVDSKIPKFWSLRSPSKDNSKLDIVNCSIAHVFKKNRNALKSFTVDMFDSVHMCNPVRSNITCGIPEAEYFCCM